MLIDILTLFPKMFSGPFDESIIKRAEDKGLVQINIHNIRDWATDKHKTVDDRPYGGGVGMIMKIEVIDRALSAIKSEIRNSAAKLIPLHETNSNFQKSKPKTKKNTKIVLLDAGGKKFTQQDALRLSKVKHLIFISGHYEGIDHRVHEHLVDEVISIGDYVLTGGEIPTMVLVDSIVRLIPGVIEKIDATSRESFSLPYYSTTVDGNNFKTLEYPQYTRPENYNGWKVPKILTEGNHKEIDKWKEKEALKKTKKIRPDLLK